MLMLMPMPMPMPMPMVHGETLEQFRTPESYQRKRIGTERRFVESR